MKVLTIVGIRPDLITMCLIINKLDKYSEHKLIHTGQNYIPELNTVLLDQFNIRKPDHNMVTRGEFGEQISTILWEMENIIKEERPDRLLVQGNANSSLGVIVAKRMGIPIFHLGAGAYCSDDRVPEEINGRIIEACSDVHMAYSNHGKDNLVSRGIPRHKIHTVGNPILEVMESLWDESDMSDIIEKLDLKSKEYFLSTIHRSETIDDPIRLSSVMDGLNSVGEEFKLSVVIPLHPHTQASLKNFRLDKGFSRIRMIDPLGFLEFLKLERHATCILTDSGVVSEEAALLNVPNVILRDSTERGEVLECGSGIVAGTDCGMIKYCVYLALQMGNAWNPPIEHMKTNVSDTVVKIVLGKYFEGGC